MKTLKPSYLILLSGGLDSVVSMYAAKETGGPVKLALTFDYGQIAAKREIEASSFFCRELGVQHKVVGALWLGELTKTALVNKSNPMPSLKDLDNISEAHASAKAVWVPNRNGTFINIAAAYAESLEIDFIVPGFNKEEAATFPDNSSSFIDACNEALSLSTLSKVKVTCFTEDLDKTGLVKKARSYDIDLNRVWSCYQGGQTKCGKCESCQRTNRAIEASK